MPYPEAIEKALYMSWSTWYFTQDSPESYKAKWLLLFWQFVILVIGAAYTANMAAFLVLNQTEDPLISNNNYEDDIANAMIGTTEGGTNEIYVTNLKERYGKTSYDLCGSLSVCLEWLSNGYIEGIVWDASTMEYQANVKNCDWQTAPDVAFDDFLVAWPVSRTAIPDSIKLEMDQAMLDMFSDGTISDLYSNYISSLNACSEDDDDNDTAEVCFF